MEGLLEIGRIGKPHGLRGEVAVDLVTTRTERLDVGSSLVAVTVTSARVPLVVEAAQPHAHRYLVRFVGVGDRTGAERLVNATLYAEPEPSGEDLFVHELIGARVVDTSGTDRGSVCAVEANPASDLLVLEDGALVPVRFVTGFSDGILVVDVPEGLFE